MYYKKSVSKERKNMPDSKWRFQNIGWKKTGDKVKVEGDKGH